MNNKIAKRQTTSSGAFIGDQRTRWNEWMNGCQSEAGKKKPTSDAKNAMKETGKNSKQQMFGTWIEYDRVEHFSVPSLLWPVSVGKNLLLLSDCCRASFWCASTHTYTHTSISIAALGAASPIPQPHGKCSTNWTKYLNDYEQTKRIKKKTEPKKMRRNRKKNVMCIISIWISDHVKEIISSHCHWGMYHFVEQQQRNVPHKQRWNKTQMRHTERAHRSRSTTSASNIFHENH